MTDDVSTFTWTCDRPTFLEVISCKNKYVEKIGLKSSFEWYFEIKLDRVPREYEIIIEKSMDEPDSPEGSVSRRLRYFNYLWNFHLCRDTDHLATNVSVKLVFGTNVISTDLSFFKGMRSQLIGTCDTTNLPDHRIDLNLTFGKSYEVDLFCGVKSDTDAEEKCFNIPISNLDKLSEEFLNLYTSKEGYDVTFKCGGEEIKAHKLVLAARSPVFNKMFNSPSPSGDEMADMVWVGEQTHYIKDVDPDIFKPMLEYMYCGRISISSHMMATRLTAAASIYKVLDLKNQINEYYQLEYDRRALSDFLSK